jgi:hypothetical protein
MLFHVRVLTTGGGVVPTPMITLLKFALLILTVMIDPYTVAVAALPDPPVATYPVPLDAKAKILFTPWVVELKPVLYVQFNGDNELSGVYPLAEPVTVSPFMLNPPY